MNPTKGNQTQNEIVAIAARLFLENGFAATTTRQITDELGKTRGILYNYFASKDEIFAAVVDEYHPWVQIIPVIKQANGNTISDFVNNAVRLLLIKWNENPEYTRLHFIELVEFKGEHLPALFNRIFNKMIKTLTVKFEGREEFGEISIAKISRSLLGLFFTYLMNEKFTGIPSSLTSTTESDYKSKSYEFDYFTDIYLQGLLTNLKE